MSFIYRINKEVHGQSPVGLQEILFLVMIRSLWSEYIVVFHEEMIETIYKKCLWFIVF